MTDSKTRLLESLAHDLRGPLSPLQTAAYLLRSGDIDPDRQRELVDIIDRQTARLSAMVQEVADWNRVEQDRLINHREISSLPMLVELACGALKSRDQAAVIDMRLPASLDDVGIDGDAQRLVQMFGTLIAYMQWRAADGAVAVTGEPPSRNRVLLTIAPCGGPPDDVAVVPAADALFGMPEAAPFDDGLGWRLMIADAIAKAHGATLSTGSTDGSGGSISVSLPVASLGGAG